MPYQITDAGLEIMSFAEAQDDIYERFRELFGENVSLTPNSPLAQIGTVSAERYVLLQQANAATVNSYDPNAATGVSLDRLADLTGSERRGATSSTGDDGKVTGTNGTVIPDGAVVRLIQTNTQWRITGGPHVIPASGELADLPMEAVETGPLEYQATGPTGWEILTVVAGWDTFETTEAIEARDVGQDIESDAEFRARRRRELFKNGNDISAVRAQVSLVDGVTSVEVFENRDCTSTSLDGIPPGNAEVVVVGGADDDIAAAIDLVTPPGTNWHGTNASGTTTDGAGNIITYDFTRPTDVDIYFSVAISVLGAETGLPDNATQLVIDAILARANTFTVGQDVIAQSFVGDVYEVLRGVNGVDSITSVSINVGTMFPAVDSIVTLTNREQPDFDATRITVTFPL